VYFFYWLIVDTRRGLYLEPLEDRSDVIDQISPVDDTVRNICFSLSGFQSNLSDF
jgi:hypothetical protein